MDNALKRPFKRLTLKTVCFFLNRVFRIILELSRIVARKFEACLVSLKVSIMVLWAIAAAANDSPFGPCRAIGVKLKAGFDGHGELCFWNTKDIGFV